MITADPAEIGFQDLTPLEFNCLILWNSKLQTEAHLWLLPACLFFSCLLCCVSLCQIRAIDQRRALKVTK